MSEKTRNSETDSDGQVRQTRAQIYLDKWERHLVLLATQGTPPPPEDPAR